MSSLRSLPQAASLWTDRTAARKSSRLAGGMTGSLMLALAILAIMPHTVPDMPMPQGALPLTLEFRQMTPLPPQTLIEQRTRKLLADDPLPESLLLPDPPPDPEPVKPDPPKPDPVPDPVKPKTVKPKPVPKPVKKAPKPVETAQRVAAQAGEATEALSTEQAKPMPVGHVDGGATRDRSGEIVAVLLHAVEAKKHYPKQARRIGAEGEVTLKVRINAQGIVTGCELVQACGKSMLDNSARTLGEKLVGLSIPPAKGAPVEVLVPVQYRLQ